LVFSFLCARNLSALLAGLDSSELDSAYSINSDSEYSVWESSAESSSSELDSSSSILGFFFYFFGIGF